MQLSTEADLQWLFSTLKLNLTDEEAVKHFEDLIEESLTCERTMMNTFFHIMKHR